MTPILQDAIQWRLYLVHAFFCAVSFVVGKEEPANAQQHSTALTNLPVWFIYPETANVRLEDMNSLFGDATTTAATPATLAEAESLFSGDRSPVPSFRLGGDGTNQDSNVPDLDIEPPHVDIQNGKAMLGSRDSRSQSDRDSQKEGVSGWISNMVNRNKGDGGSGSGRYRRVNDEEDDDGDDQGTR